MAGTRRLEDRIALITGASRGIGAAVAKRFAAEGARLILTARTVGGLEEIDDAVKAEGGTATLVPMDLTQGDAIDQLGGALHEKFGRLDVLVGNAGMLGMMSPIGHIDPPVWEQTLALNLTANYRLIRSLDPLLRQSDAGRAIFVTSGAARSGSPYWGAYAVSKAGLETLVQTYAAEVAKTNIRVNIVDPGGQRTQMRAAAFPGEDPETLPHPDDRTDVFVDLAETACTRHGEIVRAR
ncbi:MAG: SDR family NAD(P)-dependent oxidoreductase [Alphaproteobacteria bacterium]|nr:SDR family NAD(P)-dependent oxidoreductase [Alphaproteobacteria bacterium]